ncbi:MAG: hypothetical protein AB1772_09910 [Candidatus Zixiibacteriota bacterium]
MCSTQPNRNRALHLTTVIGIIITSVGALAADSTGIRQGTPAQLNIVTGQQAARSAWPHSDQPQSTGAPQAERRSVGSALMSQVPMGPGVSVIRTYDDAQYTVGQGRHIARWWNGESGENMQVDVHFGYRAMDSPPPAGSGPFSGYNVYDASVPTGNWPLGQEIGGNLQSSDTLGWGGMPSLDTRESGLAVIAATNRFFRTLPVGLALLIT